ncbi:hypothetical protein [Streptomyces sp. VRA16 Mangrove soil]|uniref:hypothetical protein n=1 Tax=Streptomyces sp. VRA16 Mangrove soil TaxID=2817434 RepID=UPI001A9E56FA|nr:hypothetical protein [Streptomyces sp. VRA16 Mangrove soil]MBO1337870.1 hypothetical protein [Streptomyces sp. VRA16 Mangrove soil]
MGIESDQLVFDYLSRVGDLAHQHQLPSATRMRLVTELRGEIDRRRAKATVDSPAAVRRILDRLGTPERIVGSATGAGVADPAEPLTRPVPEQRTGGRRRIVPRPRRAAAPEVPDDAPAPPHLAGTDELGASDDGADWWRTGGSGMSLAETDSVPGFVGGVEIPDILKPPPARREGPDLRKRAVEPEEAVEEAGADDAADEEGPRARRIRLAPVGGLTNPLLLLSAVALVVGAVLGNVLVLLIGWAVVYLSRTLTVLQKKFAVFWLPGLAVTGGIVWLWGRSAGKWGAPIAEGRMSGAFDETWPWVLRCAAIASALYLLWRSQRPRI